MPALPATLCLLFSACFLLGATTRRHWRAFAEGAEPARRGIQGLGGISLGGSAFLFAARFGWEVGLAWFVLWFALAAFAATLWLSLRPRSAVWAGSLMTAAALVAWMF